MAISVSSYVCNAFRKSSIHDWSISSKALGLRVQILGEKLRHSDINRELGKPGAYTDAVEAFMGSLDPAVKALLTP